MQNIGLKNMPRWCSVAAGKGSHSALKIFHKYTYTQSINWNLKIILLQSDTRNSETVDF